MPEEFLMPTVKVINGDQLVFHHDQGRLDWYMRIGTGLYRVIHPDQWPRLPDETVLERVRQAEHQRLDQWLKAREAASRRAEAPHWTHHVNVFEQVRVKPPSPPPLQAQEPKHPPGTDYHELAHMIAVQADQLEQDERSARKWAKQRTKKHKAQLKAIAERIESRWLEFETHWRRLTNWEWACIDDHDYIEAMFALYSRERYRLL